MNPLIFTLAGVTFPLSKVLSCGGLVLDLIGVVLLVLNELASRRAEFEQLASVSPFTDETLPFPWEDFSDAMRRASSSKQMQDFSDASARIPQVRRMTWRAIIGIALIGFGFLFQLFGTALS